MLQLHKKVVVIDDDKKVLMLLNKVLQKMGCKVLVAANGKAGLKLVRTEKPHLLICDMYLPGIQGAELVKTIREHKELDNTKIILITAVYKELSMEAELHTLSDGFINKPIDLQKLVEMIVTLMKQ